MPGFSDVLGHNHIVEYFKHAIEEDRISHAYIFHGEAGSGKKMMARLFSMALQCEEDESEPCTRCRSCKQAASGNHPDIKWVTHEKPTTISVEDVRNQIVNDVEIKPYSSRYKIYIVEDAQMMTQQAQNALLKTIEEPPEYAVILLLSTNKDIFLQTVLSRCVLLDFKPLPAVELKQYLMDNLQVTDYKADVAVAFSGGNMGKAMKLAASEHFSELKENVLQVVKFIDKMDTAQVVDAVKRVAVYKLEVDDYLDLMSMWYRDVLMYKVSRNAGDLIFKDEYKYISEQASKFSYEGTEKVLDAIYKVKTRLKANVNFDLTIELMLLTIKENMG